MSTKILKLNHLFRCGSGGGGCGGGHHYSKSRLLATPIITASNRNVSTDLLTSETLP